MLRMRHAEGAHVPSAEFVVPAPRDSNEKPFSIGDELSVFEAAMIYAGRHPALAILQGGDIGDHLAFLKAGIRDQERRKRARAQRSWDIYCTLVGRIERREIRPLKLAYDARGNLDPRRTTIETSVLVDLAVERGERPKYLRHRMPDQSLRLGEVQVPAAPYLSTPAAPEACTQSSSNILESMDESNDNARAARFFRYSHWGHLRSHEPKGPSRPAYKKDRAKQAMRALWPDGVPDQSILGNGPLCKKVAEWIEQDCKQQNVSPITIIDDTILRAAGRTR
jgi:hypothetical protein